MHCRYLRIYSTRESRTFARTSFHFQQFFDWWWYNNWFGVRIDSNNNNNMMMWQTHSCSMTTVIFFPFKPRGGCKTSGKKDMAVIKKFQSGRYETHKRDPKAARQQWLLMLRRRSCVVHLCLHTDMKIERFCSLLSCVFVKSPSCVGKTLIRHCFFPRRNSEEKE